MYVSAIIFVVDSNNKERMEESHAELVKLLTEKRLSDALLLVYANKQVMTYSISFRNYNVTAKPIWKRQL